MPRLDASLRGGKGRWWHARSFFPPDASTSYGWHLRVYRYHLHDTTGDDLGMIEHPAANVEPGAG